MIMLLKKIEEWIDEEYSGKLENLQYDIDNVIKDLSISKPIVGHKTRTNNLLFLYQLKNLIQKD